MHSLTLKDETVNEVTRELEIEFLSRMRNGEVGWLLSRYKNLNKLVVRELPNTNLQSVDIDCSKIKELQFYDSHHLLRDYLIHKSINTLEILRISGGNFTLESFLALKDFKIKELCITKP